MPVKTPVSSRTAVPKRVRFAVLRRDGFMCRYCGACAPDVTLTIDHVVPVILGGSNDPANLVTSCEPCNSGKSSTSPDEGHVSDVADSALRWSAAMQQAAADLRSDREAFDAALNRWSAAWSAWTCSLPGQDEEPVPLPDDWRASVRAMLEAGADLDTLIEFVTTTMRSKAKVKSKFRYFCGCAWNHVTALQDKARQILDAPTETDDGVCSETDEAYWSGHIRGWDEGYEEGLEQGRREARTQRQPATAPDGPVLLADLLQPLKEE